MATKIDRVEVGYILAKQFKGGGCNKVSYSTGGKSGFVFFTDKSVCDCSYYDDKQKTYVTVLTNKKASGLLRKDA